VDGNTLIFFDDGTVDYIKNFGGAWYTGMRPTFLIKTSSGKELICTGDHKVFTREGWKRVGDLKIGEEIFVQNEIPIFGNLDISDDKVKILAYLITDGSFNSPRQSIKFTGKDPYISEFIDAIKREFPDINPKLYKKGNRFDVLCTAPKKGRAIRGLGKSGKSTIIGMKSNSLRSWLSNLKFIGKIPKIAFQFNKRQLALFINRLYSADGYISIWKDLRKRKTMRIEIGFGDPDKQTLIALQMLLFKFGIHGSITEEKPKPSSKKKKPLKQVFFRLRIWRKDSVKRFLEEIGPIFGKEEKCEEALKILKSENNGKTSTI
jgi:replicative DNA helicase